MRGGVVDGHKLAILVTSVQYIGVSHALKAAIEYLDSLNKDELLQWHHGKIADPKSLTSFTVPTIEKFIKQSMELTNGDIILSCILYYDIIKNIPGVEDESNRDEIIKAILESKKVKELSNDKAARMIQRLLNKLPSF